MRFMSLFITILFYIILSLQSSSLSVFLYIFPLSFSLFYPFLLSLISLFCFLFYISLSLLSFSSFFQSSFAFFFTARFLSLSLFHFQPSPYFLFFHFLCRFSLSLISSFPFIPPIPTPLFNLPPPIYYLRYQSLRPPM